MISEAGSHLPTFSKVVRDKAPEFFPLRRQTNEQGGTTTLQVNIGKRCNLICRHCHVESSPSRNEAMDSDIINRLIYLIDNSPNIKTLDITGGAPELHPNFKHLVQQSRKRGLDVIDRCNLTVFYEENMNDIPQFLADNVEQ